MQHNPEQLAQLVGLLEAGHWLYQSRQHQEWARILLKGGDAMFSWVVHATDFKASGGVVVAAGSQSPAAAAAAAAEGGSGSPGSTCRRPALALAPQVICGLDLLAHALIVTHTLADDMEEQRGINNLHVIIRCQDVELLLVMLLLGMPATYQAGMHPNLRSPLALALDPFGPDGYVKTRHCDAAKQAAIIKVCGVPVKLSGL
jgi:hypothetical protein